MSIASAIHFHKHEKEGGALCVYQGASLVPFDIKRVFTVSGEVGSIRGNHAHRRCTQLLVCVSGQIKVSCDDSAHTVDHVLSDMSQGLLVPPGIWAIQEYLTDAAVLMVLCDRGYEADDYIHDYQEFKNHIDLQGTK